MLSGLGMEEKIEALSLCYSESPWNYDAKHYGGYTDVCGVDPRYWKEHLKGLGIKPNSILGGYYVYKYYLNKTKSPVLALKEFKGINISNKMWVVYKIRRVTEEVKKQNKELIKIQRSKSGM